MNAIQILRREKDVTNYPGGAQIFAEGDPGDMMYVLLDGIGDIVHDGKVVETIEQGGIFGEMALIDTSPRSASAIARTECNIARINEKRFVYLTQTVPDFALDVMRILVARLRNRMSTPPSETSVSAARAN